MDVRRLCALASDLQVCCNDSSKVIGSQSNDPNIPSCASVAWCLIDISHTPVLLIMQIRPVHSLNFSWCSCYLVIYSYFCLFILVLLRITVLCILFICVHVCLLCNQLSASRRCLQYITRNMHWVRVLMCFVRVIKYWDILHIPFRAASLALGQS